MEYFLSHLPQISIAALVVSGAAVLWSYSLQLAAKRKSERQARLRAEAEARSGNAQHGDSLENDEDDQWRMLK